MTTPELTKWLRENSSGAYRPASEAADLIDRLANVLRHTVGIMDALKIIDTLPGMTAPERIAVAMFRDQIREMLDDHMPDWADVCRDIHQANAHAQTPATGASADTLTNHPNT